MPAPGDGTRDSPGQISLWLIPLGAQKDFILQWLSKDELIEQKSVQHAVKFVRARLMEGRAHSEARQDLDARLTPIRYEDLRYTQGESHTRHQVSNTGRQPFVTPRNQRPQSNFSSLATSTNLLFNASENACNKEDLEDEDDLIHEVHEDRPQDRIDTLDPEDESLLAINVDQHRSRSAVSATFRGYCSEAFVDGKCARQHSGCTFDHSTAGQERCIQSFSLLTKRELLLHGQLEPWSSPKQEPTSGVKTSNSHEYKHYGPP